MRKDRDDVAVNARSNDAVYNELRSVGGVNIYNENNFRIVLAQGVRKLRGGNWHKYRDGANGRDMGTFLLDEEGRKIPKQPEKPLSITTEYRWVRTYPQIQGWIIEEWHPAHKFGPPSDWGRQKVEGRPDMAMLGPYPDQGKYMLAAPNSAPEQPGSLIIRVSINYIARCRAFWGNLKPEARRRLEEDSDLHQQALIEKYENDRRDDMIKEAMSPVLKTSLAAGRWREQIAQEARAKGIVIGHVGN